MDGAKLRIKKFMQVCLQLLLGITCVIASENAWAKDSRENQSSFYGIVPIESTYRDTADGHSETYVGTATIFQILAPPVRGGSATSIRLFALTSSHVSRGSDIRINGRRLTTDMIRGRRTDVIKDLDLIELPSDFALPIGTWIADEKRIYLDKQLLESWVGPLPLTTAKSPRYVKVDGYQRLGAFVIRGPWARTGTIPFNMSNWRKDIVEPLAGDPTLRSNGLVSLFFSGEKFARAKITPGMSGSPLIQLGYSDLHEGERYAVSGVTTRYLWDSTGSYFASDEQIAELIESYLVQTESFSLQGYRADWVLRNCMLFRENKNAKFKEISEVSQMAKSYRGGDGGGYRNGDGGDSLDDGRSAGDDSERAVELASKCAIYKSKEPSISQIKGGITLNGEQTIGFRFPKLGNVVASADMLEFLYFSTMDQKCGSYEPIAYRIDPKAQQPDFPQLLMEKFSSFKERNRLFAPKILPQVQATRHIALRTSSPKQSDLQYIHIYNDRLVFQLRLASKSANSMTPNSVEDVEFTLGSNGSRLDPQTLTELEPYTGFVNVEGSRRTKYRLDIQSVFFADLSQYQTDAAHLSDLSIVNGLKTTYSRKESSGFQILARVLFRDYCPKVKELFELGPRLRVAIGDTGQSYTIQFDDFRTLNSN